MWLFYGKQKKNLCGNNLKKILAEIGLQKKDHSSSTIK